MALRFVLWFIHTSAQAITFVSLLFPLTLLNLTVNWYDVYSRVMYNDFYINFYYFSWTSFWYIPLLVFLIILIQWSLSMRNIISTIWYSIYILFFIVSLDIHWYWSTNVLYHFINLQPYFFNSLLLNSINKFHPGLLYWSSLYSISLCFSISNLTHINSCKFTQNANIRYYQKIFSQVSVILLVTLGLGGWWALQEGSWGGWWNWDPSEVFGLIILLFFLKFSHQQIHKQNINYINYSNMILFILLFQIYFFTQINFDLVSHNFGTKIDNFIDNTRFYLFNIMLSWFVFIFFLNFINKQQLTLKAGSTHNIWISTFNTILYVYFVIILFSYELIYGLVPLINDFFWKLINVSVTTLFIEFEKYNLELTYLIILNFWKCRPLTLLLPFILSISIYPLICLYVRIPLKSVLWFHFLLFIFIWSSLITTPYVYTEWLSNTSSIYQNGYSQNFALNSFFIDYMFHNYGNINLNSTWNTFINDSTVEIYSFVFDLSLEITHQSMLVGSVLSHFNIQVIDILSTRILIVISTLLILYASYFYKIIVILF